MSTIVVNNYTNTPQQGETDLQQALTEAQNGDTIDIDPTSSQNILLN